MIDRTLLINTVRQPLFHGAISLDQMSGITAIVDEWEKRQLTDERWLACLLGQPYWESGQTMQPVREAFWMSEEWRRENLRYWPFYGRGLIQCTWEDNYRKFTVHLHDRFGIDFVANPDAMLRMDVSVAVMYEGMLRTDLHFDGFTGVALNDYFNDHTEDWYGQRRVVNGTDHAQEVGDICKTFYIGLGGKVTGVAVYQRTLEYGDVGDDVRLVQSALQVQGFLTGDVDGIFGRATQMAVFGFQRAKKIGVDGEVGPETRTALNVAA
jgi:hypothetical protein